MAKGKTLPGRVGFAGDNGLCWVEWVLLGRMGFTAFQATIGHFLC